MGRVCAGGEVELIFMLAPNTAVLYPLSHICLFLDWWNAKFLILAGGQEGYST